MVGTREALESAAYIDGRRSGFAGYSPSSNPHPSGSPENLQWEQGRLSAMNQRAAERAHRLTLVSPCRYTRGASCDCGGQGRCLDIA